MFPTIKRMAMEIDTAWSRYDYAASSFCDVATRALSEPLDFGFEDLARGIFTDIALPIQRRLDQGFGQPAITLFRNDKFLIEALCWHTSTPAIHHHAFSGAFRLVNGRSVHSRYSYSKLKQKGRLLLGSLSLEEMQVLQTGTTIAIPHGTGLIHANFHLDSPTMTLVARTHQTDQPELTYLHPGIAYDPAARTEILQKRIEMLDTMHQIGHIAYRECLDAALHQADDFDALALLIRAGARVETSMFFDLMRQLPEIFCENGELFEQALIEERRRGIIVRLRSSVTEPDDRFFLAALLSCSRRDELLTAIKLGSCEDPYRRIAEGVANLLGGDTDKKEISRAAGHAMLMDVPLEEFAGWSARSWSRNLDSHEASILTEYFDHVLHHPLLSPLAG